MKKTKKRLYNYKVDETKPCEKFKIVENVKDLKESRLFKKLSHGSKNMA